MDGTGDDQVKKNKSDWESQILHAFSHRQNLDSKWKDLKVFFLTAEGRGDRTWKCHTEAHYFVQLITL
jgi:hypothetical protein